MPRAILAMRRYPATMLLAIVLFLATLVITATSLGTVVNGGGEDGDGGIQGEATKRESCGTEQKQFDEKRVWNSAIVNHTE